MSNLDKKYSIHLDLINNIKNENMKFSLSDNETSDFYIKITKSMISIDLADKVVSLYVVKPNKNVVHTTVTLYTKCKKANVFYCDLPNNFKNIKGSYYAQILIEDIITGEKVVTPSKFSYTVESDIISEESGIIDTEENKNILDSILSDLTELKANKITINDTSASATTVYSSNKIESIKEELSSQISAIGGSGGSGYTHPATHPASMITGLSTIATSGNYEDLTNKPTIPNKTSQLTNDSNFVNSTYVNNKISEAQLSGGEVDLSGYATTDMIPTKTSQLTNDSGYITSIPSEYITETELNDKGYLTEHQSLDNYITKSNGNASLIKFSDGEDFQTKLNNGTLKGEKGDTGTQGPQGIQGVKGEDGLTTDISLNGTTYTHSNGTITLPDYPTVPTNVSEFTNDSGYITNIPDEYITEEKLNTKGYLTEHQDISNLALKSELHNHTNKTILDNITSDKVTSWDNKSEFSGNYNDLTNKPTIPNKTSELTNDSDFVNSTFVTDKIAEASLSGGEVDLSGYQTRTDNTLNTKDKTIVGGINEIKASVDSIEIPTKTSDLINDSGYLTEHQNLDGYAKTTDLSTIATTGSYNDLTDKPTIPSKTSQLTNDAGFITLNEVPVIDLSGYVTKELGNASQITFSDGQTFQAKLDAGILKGDKGDQGLQGVQGEKGDKGDKGDTGEQGIYNVKVIGQNISGKKYTNIKLLGDSITDGYGGTNYNGSQSISPSTNTQGYCWANNFKKFLRDRYNITVVNKGMYGTKADAIYKNISDVVSDTDDLVIYLTGTNDRASSDLTGYKNSVKNIIAYVKNIGADIIVMSGVPATEANENGFSHTMQDMDDVVKIICSETNTPFISMYQEYVNYCETHSVDISTTFYDHCHPNNLGYYIIFVLLCKKLYLPLNPYKNYKYQPTDEPANKSVTNISIASETTIGLNGTTSLTASITPSDATNKEVTWSANNDNVTLTPNGLTCQVQAMKVGTSIITVTSNDTTNGTISSNCTVTISENATDNYTLLCGNLDYTGTGNGAITVNAEVVPMILERDFDKSNYTTICSNKIIKRICLRIHTAGKLTIGKVDLTQYKKNTDITIIDAVQYDVTPGLNTLDVNISCGAHESLAISVVGDTAIPYFSYTHLTTEQRNGFPIMKHSDFKTGTVTSSTLALLGAIYI